MHWLVLVKALSCVSIDFTVAFSLFLTLLCAAWGTILLIASVIPMEG